jgi:hypothetical protein
MPISFWVYLSACHAVYLGLEDLQELCKRSIIEGSVKHH